MTAAPTRPAIFNPEMSNDPKAPLAGVEVADAAALEAREATDDWALATALFREKEVEQ